MATMKMPLTMTNFLLLLFLRHHHRRLLASSPKRDFNWFVVKRSARCNIVPIFGQIKWMKEDDRETSQRKKKKNWFATRCSTLLGASNANERLQKRSENWNKNNHFNWTSNKNKHNDWMVDTRREERNEIENRKLFNWCVRRFCFRSML